MREFIVLGHEAPTTPDFPLDDLPGAAGRLDVLCRCVNSAFCLSHAIREEVRVHLVIRDELTVHFEGANLRRLNPDERSTAALIRNALERKDEAIGAMAVETSPGVSLTRRGLAPVLDDRSQEGTVFELHEDGDAVIEVEPPEHPVFVLSDHRDVTDREADLLADAADARLRIGPERLHADHTVTVVHNWLDTDGYTRY